MSIADNTPGAPLNLAAERARLTRLARDQADELELKNALLRRGLVPRQVAQQAAAAGIERVRSKMEELSAKIAPRLAAAQTVAEAEAMFTDIVREALEELPPDDGPGAA